MYQYLLLPLFIIITISQTQLNLDLKPQSQSKLSLSLKTLVDQLQYFHTNKQNSIALQSKVDDTYKCLQDVKYQLSQYNNVIVGQQNTVNGSKNLLVGNYDSITGSNNFVFVDNYEGTANCDLLIGKWRIELDKKQWIKINPSLAIFFINQEENRKYQRFLNRNTGFNYGSNLNKNSITLVKDIQQEVKSQLQADFASLTSQNKIPIIASNSSNLIGDQQNTSLKNSSINNLNSNNLNSYSYTVPTNYFASNSSNYPQTSQVSNNNKFLPYGSASSSISQINLNSGSTSTNAINTGSSQYSYNSSPLSQNVKPTQASSSITSNLPSSNNYQSSSLNYLRSEDSTNTKNYNAYNAYNAQIRNNLGSKYLRTSSTAYPVSTQTAKSSSQQIGSGQIFSNQGQLNLASAFSYFKAFN